MVAALVLEILGEGASLRAAVRNKVLALVQAAGCAGSSEVPFELLPRVLQECVGGSISNDDFRKVRAHFVDDSVVVPLFALGDVEPVGAGGGAIVGTPLADAAVASYDGLSLIEMKKLLVDRDIVVASLRDQVHKLQRSKRKLEQKACDYEQIVKGHVGTIAGLKERLFLRRGLRNVSIFGGYSIAVKGILGTLQPKLWF